MHDWFNVYEALKARVESFGIAVLGRPLGLETTGVFDGLSVTTNTAYDWQTRCHNLAHSFGHIAQWSLDYARQQELYEELNAAKAGKQADPRALERALDRFRRYEEEASEYAAWLYLISGQGEAVSAFTNFARADIEAIVTFHRDGTAPVWHRFFADWNRQVAEGKRSMRGFDPKPVPVFRPVPIPPQDVIREVHDRLP